MADRLSERRRGTGTLRVARVQHDSVVDGPGLRYVIFTQGCVHNCPDCHNPQTHPPGGGYEMTIDELLADIWRNPLLKGVTFSGGEPFLQAEVLTVLARMVRVMGLDLWIYTGFLWEKIMERPDWAALASLADVVVDGLFIKEQKTISLPWRGSKNQRLISVADSLREGLAVELSV